ncbi:MAG: hypothetical protein FJ291_09990 [Planctomycetes bacterium]|nr:hypothetical protein [Planctomycetota bacterium]
MVDKGSLWRRVFRSPLLAYGLLALFGGFVWWRRARDLDLLYATYGLGPMSYVYKGASPQSFALDFPSGGEGVSKSAAMLVYPFAYHVLGIAPERVWPAFLAFELALTFAVVVALVRTLRPGAPPVVGAIVAALAMASDARDMNFASFRQPCLWASFYNVADALRLLAIVCALRGRPVVAGALLGAAFTAHPTMGLMGALFVLCCLAIRPRELLEKRVLAGGLLFLVIAGAWAACLIRSAPPSAGEFPSRLWFDLTRLFSAHWYPLEAGLLTAKHRAAFLPFLSFLALLGYYLSKTPHNRTVRRLRAGPLPSPEGTTVGSRRLQPPGPGLPQDSPEGTTVGGRRLQPPDPGLPQDSPEGTADARGAAARKRLLPSLRDFGWFWRPHPAAEAAGNPLRSLREPGTGEPDTGERERRVGAGVVGMLALMALGLAFSAFEISPTLTKLAFHRANDLVLTLGLAYIVAGLWEEVGSGPAWRAIVGGIVLASPFFSYPSPGFPLLASVLLVAPACSGHGRRTEDEDEGRGRGRLKRWTGRLPFLLPAAAGVIAVGIYTATGVAGPATSAAYTGLNWLATKPVLVGHVLFCIAVLVRSKVHWLAQVVLVAGLAAGAVLWQLDSPISPGLRIEYRAYKDAQLWARDHTPPDALFMVDPVLFRTEAGYGWRDYSRRPSFGSVREWLYLSWHYTSDYALCKEGLRRVAEFEVDIALYLGTKSPRGASGNLCYEVWQHYNFEAIDEWRLALARRYNISYFVSRTKESLLEVARRGNISEFVSRKLADRPASRLPVVYENDCFVIQAATEPAK